MASKQARILLLSSLVIVFGGSLYTAQSVWACATCGCSLSSDAATGFTTRAGWQVGLQYDYIDQNQLRHGTGTASVVPPGTEYEKDTTNRYYTGVLNYAPNTRWNLSLLLPYVVRDHSTYGEYDPAVPLELSTSHSASWGDMKLIGNYQGFLPTHNFGVQLGFKLPTGKYGNAVDFSTGPLAGEPLDTSLQPGTGSTDIILGSYYYQALSQDWDGFAHVTYEFAVKTRFDYRPGNNLNMSAGGRYITQSNWVPQIQFNLVNKARDSGANADADNSGGTFVYVSPGLSYVTTEHTQFYGFVQLPVYQNLDGYQLAPQWTLTLGFMQSF